MPSVAEVVLTPHRLAGSFALVAGSLVLVHVLVQVVRFATGDHRLYGLVYFVSLGADDNLPTLYQTFALFFSSILTAMIAARSSSDRVYWWILALAFVFLTVDEAVEIHERLIEPVRHAFGTGGVLYYAWVIPYGIGTAIFALAYMRFLARLPRKTALLFVLAGVIFVSGALGLEMLGGVLAEAGLKRTPMYVLYQTIEETFEMGGIVLFIYALADYLAGYLGGLTIRLRPAIAVEGTTSKPVAD